MAADKPRFMWEREIPLALATGAAATAMPVHRWSRTSRWAMHLGLGAASAGAVAVMLRNPRETMPRDGDSEAREPIPPRTTTAIAAAVALVGVGLSAGGTALDGATERALDARGVRHPRLWIGAGAALISVGLAWLDTRFDSPADAHPA